MEEKTKKEKNRFVSWLGWLGVALVSLGGKLKALLPLLKLGKFGGTLISMLVSVGGYAIIFPFHIALGLVVMIFVHEMGHVWAARLKGLPVSAPAFIPFLGAYITMKRQPSDAATESFIAFGGPLLGTIGALVCYGLGVWLNSEILMAIAYMGFFINLFNLLPVHPLDGGRIVIAVTRWLWVVGLVFGLVLIFYLHSLVLLLVYAMFLLELWSQFRSKKRMAKPKDFIMQAKLDPRRFEEASVWIPGEAHRRDLPFRQYCLLETKEHLAEVGFPGIGTILKFPFTGTVHKAELVETHLPDLEESQVRMVVRLKMTPERIGGLQKDEKYYSVPANLRLAYGLAYFGLALFLGYMVFHLGSLPKPAQVGY